MSPAAAEAVAVAPNKASASVASKAHTVLDRAEAGISATVLSPPGRVDPARA
jgi:hypothetical protein